MVGLVRMQVVMLAIKVGAVKSGGLMHARGLSGLVCRKEKHYIYKEKIRNIEGLTESISFSVVYFSVFCGCCCGRRYFCISYKMFCL